MTNITNFNANSGEFQRVKIMFYHKKSRANSKGVAPIWSRITISGKRTEITTGIFIPPSCFVDGEIIGNTTELIRAKKNLSVFKFRIFEVETDLRVQGKIISGQKIREILINKNLIAPTFFKICELYLKRKEELIGFEIKARQYARYYCFLNQLKEFVKVTYHRNDMELDEIRPKFGLDFYHYLITIKKWTATYSAKSAGILKSIIDYAIIEEYTRHNPLRPLRFKRGKDNSVYYLSIEQVKKLLNTRFESDALTIVRDIFLFQCFTGMAYADVSAFSLQHIHVDGNQRFWILINRQKTGTKSTIPLLPEALEIINKYKDIDKSTLLQSTPFYNKGILPVFSNQVMNRLLKQIGLMLNIEGNIFTTHVARKTFATTVLNTAGVSIETVSAMLGHSNINITQKHYAQVDQRKISREMNDFKFLTT